MKKKLNHVWHPATQMKRHETIPLLEMVSASGCYLHLANGKKIFDAISSWWCKSLGHSHPRLKIALIEQIEKFEHVILAGTTNDTITQLSAELCRLTKGLNKIFYASDGSCAVEIAIKMSLHARRNQGDAKRKVFLALENSYHGETIGALSVSDVGVFRKPYESLLFPVKFISSVPYVSSQNDLLWHDCSEQWIEIEKQLACYSETATAILIEPIVQGSGGMKIYSQDFLRRLRRWTNERDIHLIADEIMTGVGRTGKMFACDYADITPDFMCLSKGLTSGWLPLSCVMVQQKIYDLFYSDEMDKTFLHSHTFSGNALAASVALETLRVMREEKILDKLILLEKKLFAHFKQIADETGVLQHVRAIGAIAAAETKDASFAKKITQRATELGVLMRPLGQTLYWLPPFIANENDLLLLADATKQAIICASG